MKLLCVHNRYLLRGGEDESAESEAALLRANGHEIVEYTCDNHSLADKSLLNIGVHSIWNRRSYNEILQTIRSEKIDLVKVDNFFPQVSPAVYYAAHAAGVPTVQSLRNFRIGCPGATLFRDGAVCEVCVGKGLAWPGILHGCYRNSPLVSIAPAMMAGVHRLMGTWNNRVTAYVALSEFSRDKFLEIGLPGEKIFVKPNFVRDTGLGAGDGEFALFVGRLSPEKGIDTLLEAWKLVGGRIKLKIVGTGPLQAEVAAAVATNPAVELTGSLPLDRVYELMGSASMVIFPSKWFETFGRIVAEAFSKGTPVIAASLGHMPKMIEHQGSGLLFEAGNAKSLAEQVLWMLDHRERWASMREAARAAYERHYTPELNYRRMMEIYQAALATKRTEVEVQR